MKKPRVFCGYSNTGGIAYKIAEGLRKNNIKADSVVISEHDFSYPYHKKIRFSGQKDNILNKLLKYYYFIKHTLSYNIFIFNTRSTLLARKWDLKILKLLGKKTAMVYIGCDIRDKDFYLRSHDKYTVCKNCTDDYQKKIGCVMEHKLKETRMIQKYIDVSFSHPFDAMILHGNYKYLYLLLELEKYTPVYSLNTRIKIVHAPSDDGIKGTKYVISAIEELKTSGAEFEFELLRNKSHSEIINSIRNADIVIDQMVAGWYGLISIEAMAFGKTVVCYINDRLYEYLPDLPIVNLNPDNLTQGLDYLIKNHDELMARAKAGRKFVEKYHDYINNSYQMLKIILNSN